MVSANDLVTVRHIGARAKEQCTITCHMFEEPVVAICHDLNMLGRNLVSHLQHLIIGIADNHFAIIAPADGCRVCGRQNAQQAVNFGKRFICQRFGIRQQHSR